MQTPIEKQFKKCLLASPDKILVATDLNDTKYLMPHVMEQAKASGAQVTLLHVIPPSVYAPFSSEAAAYVDQAKIMRDIRLMLLGLAHELEGQGIHCDTLVRNGEASVVIEEELHHTGAKRLIMGTHGRGRLGQFVLGSVAQMLIPVIDVPVFLIGPHAQVSGSHTAPRKLLHPVSLMGDYRETVELALNVAQTYRAELTLLHVLDKEVEQEINPERTMRWAKQELQRLAPNGENLVPPIHIAVRVGKLEEEIMKAAAETQADWILLGADGGYRAWPFVESAAYKVLAASPCPVLTLRHEPRPVQTAKLEEVHFTSPL